MNNIGSFGENILSKIKSDNHQILVTKLIESSLNQNYTTENASNKIIAMLRMNP